MKPWELALDAMIEDGADPRYVPFYVTSEMSELAHRAFKDAQDAFPDTASFMRSVVPLEERAYIFIDQGYESRFGVGVEALSGTMEDATFLATGSVKRWWETVDRAFDREESDLDHDRIFQGIALHTIAILSLAQQRLGTTSREPLSRPVLRRIKRAGRDIETINVIRLRRSAIGVPSGETREIAWSHRWPVRGHWRMKQWIPSLGRYDETPRYIASFIKGPPDKPLVLKDRVYELIR